MPFNFLKLLNLYLVSYRSTRHLNKYIDGYEPNASANTSLFINHDTNSSNSISFVRLLIAMPIILGMTLLAGCFQNDQTTQPAPEVLNLYGVSDSISPQVVKNFTNKTGIEVVVTTSNDPQEVYDTLMTGNHHYDLVIASSYYIRKLIESDKLASIDHAKIEVLERLNPALLDPIYDPNNIHSVPYLWGATGLAYQIDDNNYLPYVESWSDMWLAGEDSNLVLVNDMRDVFAMALLTLGYSINTEDPQQIYEAYQKLRDLLPSVIGFSKDTKDYLLRRDAELGMMASHDFNTTTSSTHVDTNQNQPHLSDSLRFVYPNDGALIWINNFVIPKNAEHSDAAHEFISYALRAENAMLISEDTGYSSTNMNSKIFNLNTSEAGSQSDIKYPSAETLSNAHLQIYMDDKTLATYTYFWDKLQTEYAIMHNK